MSRIGSRDSRPSIGTGNSVDHGPWLLDELGSTGRGGLPKLANHSL